MEKIKNSKKIICEILCFVFGIVCSLIGLYYYHFQYLCYHYTPLLFILAIVVCLGSALLSLCISVAKNKDKKAKIKNSVFSALLVAIILLVITFIINLSRFILWSRGRTTHNFIAFRTYYFLHINISVLSSIVL